MCITFIFLDFNFCGKIRKYLSEIEVKTFTAFLRWNADEKKESNYQENEGPKGYPEKETCKEDRVFSYQEKKEAH